MQSPPEMTQAGVSSFGAFLAKCDNMVAFASPTYFSRMWCVYELAVFKSTHPGRPVRLLPLRLAAQPPLHRPLR